jgi:hypothetical protein
VRISKLRTHQEWSQTDRDNPLQILHQSGICGAPLANVDKNIYVMSATGNRLLLVTGVHGLELHPFSKIHIQDSNTEYFRPPLLFYGKRLMILATVHRSIRMEYRQLRPGPSAHELVLRTPYCPALFDVRILPKQRQPSTEGLDVSYRIYSSPHGARPNNQD